MVEIKTNIERLDTLSIDYSEQLVALYRETGKHPHPDCTTVHEFNISRIRKALCNSYACFGAFDGDKMVGFARALSDGISDAYIAEIIVSPSYGKLEIGTKLCASLVKFLKEKKIEWITAIATPEAFSLYSKVGAQMVNHTPFRF